SDLGGLPRRQANEVADGHFAVTPSAFISEYRVPEYTWDGILQRGYEYALTAPSGQGKTAICVPLALSAATGRDLAGRSVAKGNVIVLAGENPDDYRPRLMVAAARMNINLADLDRSMRIIP